MNNKNNDEKNCCAKNSTNVDGNKHKPMIKHGLMMLICCLAPILIIALIPFIGPKSWSLGSLAFLLCPILHIGMMVFMMKSGKGRSCHGSSEQVSSSGAEE